MAESNPVPFEVLVDSTDPFRIGLELEVYEFDNPTQIIDFIPNRTDLAFLDEMKNPGGGSFSIMKDDPKLIESPNLLDDRNLVKCRLDGKVIGGFLIRDQKTVYADKTERSGEKWQVFGEGLRSWGHDAVVLSYGGVKQDSQGSRVFSFASERGSWYKSADWLVPVNVHQYTMDPTPSNPWGTAPAEWPDVPEAFWVWGVNNSASSPAPIGTNFFRYEFEVTDLGVKQYSVFCAADDDFDIYMDAAQIITSREKNGYAKTWRADFDLGPGRHIFAARVKNNGGPAALIAALFQFGDAEAGTAAKLLTCTGITASAATLDNQADADASSAATARTAATSARATADAAQAAADADPGNSAKAQAADDADRAADVAEQQANDAEAKADRSASLAEQAAANEAANLPGWRVNAYPDPSPGWTPGEIMLTLLAEAAARGVRSLTHLTPTFTADTDSDGATWPRALDWSFTLGTDYFDVIARLEEVVCDVWIDPSNLDFNMYIERGTHRDVQSAAMQPVKFEIGRNVLRAGEDRTSDIKNTLLMETADGWSLEADGLTDSIAKYGRIEGFVSTGASAGVSGDVAQAVFRQKSTPETSATFDIIDVDDARPFVDFFSGDWVLAPGKTGLEPRRVMSISVAEDPKTGKPKFALEFDTIFEDQDQRHERWLRSTSDGTLGGSLANTSSGSGGGSSSPTPVAQTTQRGPQGLQGKQGPVGVVWRGAWSPAIQYAVRDAVSFEGSSWYAVVASTDEEPGSGTNWSLLARVGQTGQTGSGFVWRGAWVIGASYVVSDVVAYAGSSWLAVSDNTGDAPSDTSSSWELFVSRGETGALVGRGTGTVTSPVLSSGATWRGTISLSVGYRLYKITTDRPSRVRIYGTSAKRDADVTRQIGIDPAGDHGLLFEFVTTSSILSAYLSPLVDGASFETPVSSDIAISITNLDVGSSTVQVTLVYAVTE